MKERGKNWKVVYKCTLPDKVSICIENFWSVSGNGKCVKTRKVLGDFFFDKKKKSEKDATVYKMINPEVS